MVVEISPRSLFNRHSYLKEQQLIVSLTKEIDSSIAFISPMTELMPIPFQRLPPEYKRRKIREHLEKARSILTELGV